MGLFQRTICRINGCLNYSAVTVLAFGVDDFFAHGVNAAQDHLRSVGESHGVADRNAVFGLKDEESSEHVIYSDCGAEIFHFSEKFFGDRFGVDVLLFQLRVRNTEVGKSRGAGSVASSEAAASAARRRKILTASIYKNCFHSFFELFGGHVLVLLI